MNFRQPLGVSGLLLALLPLLPLLNGCGGGLQKGAGIRTVDLVGQQHQRSARLVSVARELKAEGRFEEAAQAYEEAARVGSALNVPELAVGPWAQAAVCWLAVGNTDRFATAIDELWQSSDDWERRAMDADVLALIALADRLEGHAPRVAVRTLPPEVRGVLEAPPVPAWKLMNADERR